MGRIQRKIIKAFRDIQRDVEKARLTALNRAAKSAFSRVLRSLREDYAIKAKDLKEHFSIKRATKSLPVVRITARQKPIGLYDFKAKQYKKGVKATVRKGKRKLYEGAFIATMRSGHAGVFMRKGKKRLPIRELYGMDPAKLFADEQAQALLEKEFKERFEIELENASRYIR